MKFNTIKNKLAFLLLKAVWLPLLFLLSSVVAKAENLTLEYNGTTYTVGSMLLDNSNYTTFYNLVSVQPWFQTQACIFPDTNCFTTLQSKFTVMPSTNMPPYKGVAITFAPANPGNPNFVNVQIIREALQIEGSVASMLDVFGGVLYVLPPSIGPSAEDTLNSMRPNASAMKNAFNRQYAVLASGLNHDCTIYDVKNLCVSAFGRRTEMNESSYDTSAAGVVLGYRVHPQFRIGTYIDQSFTSNTTGGVKVERSNPDVGVYGVWNLNADKTGFELRAAANYGKRDLTINRVVVGDTTAEAGKGRSDLNTQGALLEASYAIQMNDQWLAKPYAGMRYLSVKRDGYTETGAVDNPLSYAELKQKTTTAVAGLRFSGQLAPKVIASLNAGLEHNVHYSINDYSATGVDGLGSINMNKKNDKTRPTAGASVSYNIADKQQITAAVQYRKEIFMSESSVTAQVNYTVGF